jgi:hypothetical protein
MKPHRIAIALSALTLTGLLGNVPTASAADAPYCGITWGSQPKAVLQSTGAPVADARTGRHDCWDRLVVDLGGAPASGYDVRYVDSYRSLGLGPVVPVAGGAIVTVRAFAPANVTWRSGDHVVTPRQFSSGGYRTFRDLVYGGSNGLNTEFAVGVRARLPFRVFTLPGPGDNSRLVIDVAHRW